MKAVPHVSGGGTAPPCVSPWGTFVLSCPLKRNTSEAILTPYSLIVLAVVLEVTTGWVIPEERERIIMMQYFQNV